MLQLLLRLMHYICGSVALKLTILFQTSRVQTHEGRCGVRRPWLRYHAVQLCCRHVVGIGIARASFSECLTFLCPLSDSLVVYSPVSPLSPPSLLLVLHSKKKELFKGWGCLKEKKQSLSTETLSWVDLFCVIFQRKEHMMLGWFQDKALLLASDCFAVELVSLLILF